MAASVSGNTERRSMVSQMGQVIQNLVFGWYYLVYMLRLMCYTPTLIILDYMMRIQVTITASWLFILCSMESKNVYVIRHRLNKKCLKFNCPRYGHSELWVEPGPKPLGLG